ncbi:hypothetical protein LCGC14_2516400, partial [marine sediment metagenome]
MLSEDVKNIGVMKKRVLLEPKEVRHVVKLLKAQKGMSQKDISKSIGFLIGSILNQGCSLPYESFKKLQVLATGIHESLQVKEIKYRKSYNKQSIEQLARIIGMKKTGVAGKFLSEEYTGMNVSSKWQCGKCEKVWKTSPNAVLYKEHWCIRCQGRETWTYKQMIELGKRRGLKKTGVEGKFLTSKKEYEEAIHPDMSKYHWECGKCGHIWEASANNIKRGSWCRT